MGCDLKGVLGYCGIGYGVCHLGRVVAGVASVFDHNGGFVLDAVGGELLLEVGRLTSEHRAGVDGDSGVDVGVHLKEVGMVKGAGLTLCRGFTSISNDSRTTRCCAIRP